MAAEFHDVIIVGAGLSGIGSAWHLQNKCPDKSFLILERREALGGTWDLFRYPGIRSDSDMFTLGYAFKPWRDGKAIADGGSILDYLRETSAENGIDEHIRFGQHVRRASWRSDLSCWEVEVEDRASGERNSIRCRFVLMCAGYYSYDQGYLPEFEGSDQFRGRIVHPQFWPEDLDYADKRVIVIGSGATAVTLVPELAKKARHVTMVQRSPTYMAALPDEDRFANLLRKLLPENWAYRLIRWKNIRFQQVIYRLSRRRPDKLRKRLLNMARKELGPEVEFEKHFQPSYGPWDQRLCLVPNADFFHCVRDGKASIVTDAIDRFTEDGLKLRSNETVEGDIIVTATGLELAVLGDVELVVDGRKINIPDTWSYKSAMLSGVPNMISTFGYINASWTLKSDLVADYACRVIQHMDETHTSACVPVLRPGDQEMEARDWILEFSAGYIQRKMHLLPKQGDRAPWVNSQNYFTDRKMFRDDPIEDGVLRFSDHRQVQPSEGEADDRLSA